MEVFFPTLEQNITSLVTTFQFIVFAIMVTGLIFAAASPRLSGGTSLLVPLLKAIVISAALAYQGQWFPATENVFLDVANYVDPGYNNNPTSSSDTIRQSTTSDPQGQSWSWRHINESVYQAVTRALANVFIYIGTLITVPMLILQYILRWLLYLLTPFALAMFLVPGFSGIGVRFFQQLLAIMAWPVGFALTNLVALSVWTDFRSAVGANPQNVTDAVVYSPLLTFMGGILATIVIIVGMVSTPVVMQMLFAQGHAFTGSSGNPATILRTGAMLAGGFGRFAIPAAAAKTAMPKDPPPPPPPMGMENRPGI